ncbi:MAG: CYTH domain-containing protein [Lachnospiraceae bacterium]|nr:CYTH domain-containing protein [Lachnospiraceae bacterium]
MEIEQKYRIRVLPDVSGCEKLEMEQGYLCTDPVVRIRKSNDSFILTYKSRAGIELSDAQAQINQEVELPLTEESYLHLREKADGYLISKTRYKIPLPDGHTGELDVFHGRLEGLVFIEVEFAQEQDMAEFQPPEWFGENVSRDRRYSNSFLSTCEDLGIFSHIH